MPWSISTITVCRKTRFTEIMVGLDIMKRFLAIILIFCSAQAFGQQILICTSKKYIVISPISDPEFALGYGKLPKNKDTLKIEDDDDQSKITCRPGGKSFSFVETGADYRPEIYEPSGGMKTFIEIGYSTYELEKQKMINCKDPFNQNGNIHGLSSPDGDYIVFQGISDTGKQLFIYSGKNEKQKFAFKKVYNFIDGEIRIHYGSCKVF